MGKNKKQLKEEVKKYMKLPYTIKLIPEEDGTYFVEVEELPGCMSAGDTAEEAVEMIHEAMEAWIESNIERGLKIPLPNATKEYSGKFLVRVPVSLHKRLAEQAKKEGVSLNQFVVSLLSEKVTVAKLLKKIEKLEEEIEKSQNTIFIKQRTSGKTEKAVIKENMKTSWEGTNERKAYSIQ